MMVPKRAAGTAPEIQLGDEALAMVHRLLETGNPETFLVE